MRLFLDLIKMSYASDHLAWKQRVYKEQTVARINTFRSPIKESARFPVRGIFEIEASEHSPSNPNIRGHYDVKRTLKNVINNQTGNNQSNSQSRNAVLSPDRNIGNATFQGVQKKVLNHDPKHTKSLIHLRKGLKSPDRKNAHKLLLSMPNEGLYSSPRFPKAKPFFDQAYLPKSQLDAISQANRNENNVSKQKLKFPRELNPTNSGELPPLKKDRFNEDTMSEYSSLNKQQNVNKTKLKLAAKAQKLGIKASSASQRSEAFKNMLIKSIECMDDKEMEIMNNAIKSVRHISKDNQFMDTKSGELNQANLQQLDALTGEEQLDVIDEQDNDEDAAGKLKHL